ncbi:MAG: sigma-70 family RNA polymerase sigma factor [Planctomycetes bacterium]|nr:sigma-70 family RNA polymerase sigma factor [Planctomycetota bacterium]
MAAEPTEFSLDERRALARREPSSLQRFFDAYFPRIYAFAHRSVRDAHVAEDLTQEALMRIHRGLESYEPERSLRPWVFAIAANVVRDHLRSRAWNDRRGRSDFGDEPGDEDPIDWTPPSRVLEHAEGEASVASVVDELPAGVKRVFLLRHFEELSFVHVAEALGLTEAAARQRFSRAVRWLRARLVDRDRDAEPTR